MAANRLTMGGLVEEMEGVPAGDLNVEVLREMVGRLDLPKAVIRRHARYCAEWYTRSLLVKTPRFEIVVMGWKPGQVSSIHNHGESFGVALVWDGELRTSYFDRLDGGEVTGRAEVKEREVADDGAGAITHIDVGDIHRMGVQPDSKKNLTTIHFYARPLTWIETYHPDEDRAEKARVKYCFGEEDCRYFTEGEPFTCLQKSVIPVTGRRLDRER